MDGRGTTTVFGTAAEFISEEGQAPRATVALIRPGMSSNRLKWTAPVLKRAVEDGIFNGARMFRDHNKNNPMDRKTGELVSRVDGAVVGKQKEVVGDVRFIDRSFAVFAQEAGDALGTSVVVQYEGSRGRDKDGPYIEPTRITKAISVDWVPFPAVTGTGIMSFAQESFNMEWTAEDIAQLQKERPDLFARESSGDSPPVDVNAIAEAAAQKVAQTIETAVEAAVRKTTDAIAQEATERRDTGDKVVNYLKGVALPQLTKDRIAGQFAGDREYKEDALKLAVESAQAEFQQAGLKGPKINGAGTTAAGVASEGTSDQAVVSPGMEAAHDAAMRAFGKGTPAPAQKE